MAGFQVRKVPEQGLGAPEGGAGLCGQEPGGWLPGAAPAPEGAGAGEGTHARQMSTRCDLSGRKSGYVFCSSSAHPMY